MGVGRYGDDSQSWSKVSTHLQLEIHLRSLDFCPLHSVLFSVRSHDSFPPLSSASVCLTLSLILSPQPRVELTHRPHLNSMPLSTLFYSGPIHVDPHTQLCQWKCPLLWFQWWCKVLLS